MTLITNWPLYCHEGDIRNLDEVPLKLRHRNLKSISRVFFDRERDQRDSITLEIIIFFRTHTLSTFFCPIILVSHFTAFSFEDYETGAEPAEEFSSALRQSASDDLINNVSKLSVGIKSLNS